MALLPLSKITLDPALQPRHVIDEGAVAEYAEAMREGATFPAVVVFFDGSTYWLSSGYHRYHAARLACLIDIEADIRPGTKRDAILHSVGTNGDHGLRRTNADKRRAVAALLGDPEWSGWSDNKIAKQCSVGPHLVAEMRADLTMRTHSDLPPADRTYTDRHGNTTTMDTSNIGRREPILMRQPWPEPQPQREPVAEEEPLVDPGEATRGAPDVEAKRAASGCVFNFTNDNVSWAAWTWNPVTGCKHGCTYCYARDIGIRFNGTFEPAFHPDRLAAPANTAPRSDLPGGRNVFVGSMCDLFGEWVPQEWIDAVLEQCRTHQQWRFLFLTKNPARLATIDWPGNCWVGATVDIPERVIPTEMAFAKVNAPVKWVSCEPLRERLSFGRLDLFDWVVIGAQSKSSCEPSRQPEREWVFHLLDQARAAGCRIYLKPNLVAGVRERPEV